ncbi:efflux transporter, outer membrane factor (OMF) lipoprotein, NodT family [Microbulbifer thermotolerans]|uniref:efflux transporter outer membrane subunit n=1 Tax=Microbulbifer thermotolerans TaxID=252514 RepID=UPI0008EA4EA0|nr:efflux transporter outer membrane subunit [Microbulbifer thermotolerans]SFC10256.1 efflux transporter, outer membrane factor (OMF) lipoprotein, NodT family [Microbulbifer thermotolerans]
MGAKQLLSVFVILNSTKRYSSSLFRFLSPSTRTGCLLAVTLLGGCASLPDGTQPGDIQLPQPPSLVAAQSLSEQPVPQAWWALFNDELLAQMERDLATGNLDLQLAAARVEQSRARLGLAASAQGLQLDAAGGYSRSQLSEFSRLAALGAPTDPSDYWSLGTRASWELDLWGQLSKRTAAAGQRLLASRYALAGARVSVSAEVARTYLLLRGVQQKLRLAEKELEINRDLLALQQSRRAQGVATDYDTASARAAVAAAEAQIPLLETQRDQLMNALALLLGKAPEALNAQLTKSAHQPELPKQLPVGLPSELARRRPDILAAEAQLQAATADIAAARADFYPRITLGLSAGMEAIESADFGSWGSRTFSLGPSLYLPIFQGGRLRRMLELREAGQKEAAIRYRKTVLSAWHEVNNAMKGYSDALRRYQALQQASVDTDQALATVQRARRHGVASRIAVRQAQLAELRQERALTDAATASALSVVALYRALGGGWSDALAPAPATDTQAGNIVAGGTRG